MKLINSDYKFLEQEPGLEGIYKAIERAGRICYKSEDNITEDSAKKFVDMLIARGHTAMLEHGTVYLHQHFDGGYRSVTGESYQRYIHNPYSKVNYQFEKKIDGSYDYYITTNYRVLVENNWLDDLKYLCEPTEYHEKRASIKFITSIGIGRELLRHRILPEDWEDLGKGEPYFSYANESTRYCNYSKDKFNNELTFIIPSWLDIPEGRYKYEDQNPFLTAGGTVEQYGYDDDPNVWFESGSPFKRARVGTALDSFFKLLHDASEAYFDLLSNHTPQQAREVLPLCTKSELVMTGFISDWKKVFAQRVDGTTGKPHPDMLKLMNPVKEEFIKRNYV